jgi:hypothetical protein
MLVPSCGDETEEELCSKYARKLVKCKVIQEAACPQQKEDCITLLRAGDDEERYRCAVDAPCSELNARCGS